VEENTRPISDKNEIAPRQSPAKKTFFSFLRIIIGVIVLSFILFVVKTPYILQAPGSCENTSKFVKVPLSNSVDTPGQFFLTTVIYERANILFCIYGMINPDAELKYKKYKGKNSDKQRDNYMTGQMKESKARAKVAAFRALGYEVKLKKGPVRVVTVTSWSAAKGKIKEGDLIIKLNGKLIKKPEELIEIVKSAPPGSSVSLTIHRPDGSDKDKKKEIKIEVPLTKREKGWKIGIQIMSIIEDVELPKEVEIDSANIIGSSAGMMFSLEIMKQVSELDLAGGQKIAGTGSIDENGKVYGIEGVKFKIYAAEKKGCKYFLCQDKNAKEAEKAATTIKVLPVKNLDDALNHLKRLDAKMGAELDEYIDNIKRIKKK